MADQWHFAKFPSNPKDPIETMPLGEPIETGVFLAGMVWDASSNVGAHFSVRLSDTSSLRGNIPQASQREMITQALDNIGKVSSGSRSSADLNQDSGDKPRSGQDPTVP